MAEANTHAPRRPASFPASQRGGSVASRLDAWVGSNVTNTRLPSRTASMAKLETELASVRYNESGAVANAGSCAALPETRGSGSLSDLRVRKF
jgi:hypothetical protein